LPSAEHSTTRLNAEQSPTLPSLMDEAELCELFAACMPRLTNTARHLMRNSPDSEDVLQQGLLCAFQKLRQFQGRSKFSTWLHSIVKNTARMHLRRLNARPLCSFDEDLPMGTTGNDTRIARAFIDPGPSPEDVCGQRERSRILRRALRGLPPMYQRVIVLCDIRGVPGTEAAAMLGLSVAALKTCLHRARRRVSRKIRERFLYRGYYSPGGCEMEGR